MAKDKKRKKRKNSAETVALQEQILGQRAIQQKKKEHAKKKKKEKKQKEKKKEFIDNTIASFKRKTLKKLGGFDNFRIDVAAKCYDIVYKHLDKKSQFTDETREKIRQDTKSAALSIFEKKIGKRPAPKTMNGIEGIVAIVMNNVLKSLSMQDDA